MPAAGSRTEGTHARRSLLLLPLTLCCVICTAEPESCTKPAVGDDPACMAIRDDVYAAPDPERQHGHVRGHTSSMDQHDGFCVLDPDWQRLSAYAATTTSEPITASRTACSQGWCVSEQLAVDRHGGMEWLDRPLHMVSEKHRHGKAQSRC